VEGTRISRGCSTQRIRRGGEALSHFKNWRWQELTALFSYLLGGDTEKEAGFFPEMQVTGQGDADSSCSS